MLNILIFSDEFPPAKGGIGSVARQYSDLLSDIGHKVTVLTRRVKGCNQDNVRARYKVKYAYDVGISILSYIFNIELYKNYDVIILNDTASIYIAGLIFSKRKLNKSICIMHGSELEYVYLRSTIVKKLFLFQFFFNRTVKTCKKIVCVSNFLRNKVTSFYAKNNAPINDKCVTIYAGVRRSEFYYTNIKNDIFPEGFKEKVKLISVSRIVKKKGYGEMLDLFESLNPSISNYVWIVIGNGSYLASLKKEAKRRQLLDFILFTGELNRQDIVDYYNGSDVFWLLSRHDEGFGLSWLEAQMCGLPAVGLNKGAMKENINMDYGLVADQYDDVIQFIKEQTYLNFTKFEISTSVQYLSSEEQILKMDEILQV